MLKTGLFTILGVMATFLGDNGIEYKKILSVLNHSDNSVTAIYNRSLDFKKWKLLCLSPY